VCPIHFHFLILSFRSFLGSLFPTVFHY
jgi:hypothetical protein